MTIYKIKDISKKIFSGGTPSTANPSFWNGCLHWLSSGETSSDFIINTERFITQEGVDNSSTRLAKKNNIVIASAGQGNTRGQTSFLLIDTYINQSLIAIEADETKVLSKYLFYNLKNRYDEMRLLSNSSSTRGSITTLMIGNMQIIVPSIKEQQHIVNITMGGIKYAC